MAFEAPESPKPPASRRNATRHSVKQAMFVSSTANGILYLTTLDGGTHFFGSVVSLDMGLAPFVALLPVTGKTGQTVQILGQQLTGTTRVAFNGVPSESVSVISDTFIMAVVPPQAITGTVVVSTPNATFKSNKPFRVME